MLRTFTVVFFIIALSEGLVHSQDLSTSIFPSEDELYEAFSLGEISFDQLIRLTEIAISGVDSASLHLLEEIPNLSLLNLRRDSVRTTLESEQSALVTGKAPVPANSSSPLSGLITHRYYQDLEDDSRNKYQTSARVGFGDFNAEIRLQRNYGGREGITGRTVSYQPEKGLIREFRFGSFSRKFGLGTVIGYRGKLFACSDEIDSESFLFPDYGGQNGLYARFRAAGLEVQSLLSIQRDACYRLATSAVMLSRSGGSIRPAVIVAWNTLKNRISERSINDYKFGLNWRYEYRHGRNNTELSMQAGEENSFAGLVTEGRHRFEGTEVRYALWSYADKYVDLAGGGKAAGLSRAKYLNNVDFDYSSRRAGQTGGILKTIVELASNLELTNSFLYAALGSDTANLQWLCGMTRRTGNGSRITLDHLRKTKRRVRDGIVGDSTSTRTRLESRFRTGKTQLRIFAAWNSRDGAGDFITLFLVASRTTANHGELQIWAKVDRISTSDLNVDYWYAYLKNEIYLLKNLNLSTKLSHTYQGHYEDSNRTTVSLEMKVLL